MAADVWSSVNRRIVRCQRCPRLIEYCQRIAVEKRGAYRGQTYWGKPVANFGDPAGRLLILGLAPAAHGANRTGRMFTGDRSGEWLYRALHKAGFANQPGSVAGDGLRLIDCAITAACHCAPPDNKPSPAELSACSSWLDETWDALPVKVCVALGHIAWRTALLALRGKGGHEGPLPKFGHCQQMALSGDRWLLGSYHPSQQNTFTGRLTEPMFDAVFATARRLLDGPA